MLRVVAGGGLTAPAARLGSTTACGVHRGRVCATAAATVVREDGVTSRCPCRRQQPSHGHGHAVGRPKRVTGQRGASGVTGARRDGTTKPCHPERYTVDLTAYSRLPEPYTLHHEP